MRYASAAAAPARAAMRGRASPTPPRDTLPPTRPPRPPRERASVLNRGDPSPLFTRRPVTYKWAQRQQQQRRRRRHHHHLHHLFEAMEGPARPSIGVQPATSAAPRAVSSRNRARRSSALAMGQRPGAIFPRFLFMGNEFVGDGAAADCNGRSVPTRRASAQRACERLARPAPTRT